MHPTLTPFSAFSLHSNFNASQLAELLAVTTVPPAVNQCEFAIGDHDDDTIAFCKKHNITYEAYSPLGGLSHIDVLGDKDVLAIAKSHAVSPAQVALRWVVQQEVPFVTVCVLLAAPVNHHQVLTFLRVCISPQAATNPAYMIEDLDLFHFTLSDEEMRTLTTK